MMKKTSTKLLIVYSLTIAIIVIAVTSTAVAFWGGNPSINIEGQDSPVITVSNTTYKYMIFQANYSEGNYYLKYSSENNAFIGFQLYSDEVVPTVDSTSFTSVSLIGYTGSMGEYEDLVVPASINWYISGTTKNLSVTIINIKSAEYMESFSLIKSAVIPSSVSEILGTSFSGCPQLETVYIDSETVPKVTTNALIGTMTIKKKESGNYVNATIIRSEE